MHLFASTPQSVLPPPCGEGGPAKRVGGGGPIRRVRGLTPHPAALRSFGPKLRCPPHRGEGDRDIETRPLSPSRERRETTPHLSLTRADAWVPAFAGVKSSVGPSAALMVSLSNHEGVARTGPQRDDRSSWPEPTLNRTSADDFTSKARCFVFRHRSPNSQQFAFPFRPLSEKCRDLSPRVLGELESLHRRTESEIMTSDWCSEAGWFGCRSGSGQAGKV